MIKVCGMRDGRNMRDVAEAGADIIGMIFHRPSPRCVAMAGRCPDIMSHFDRQYCHVAPAGQNGSGRNVALAGVFVDAMPQDIVTAVSNYALDYVQLHGDESPAFVENLRRTVVPDLRPGLKVIKTISVAASDDFGKCARYEGTVDLFLFDTACGQRGGSGRKFDWSLLDAYHGSTPFLLSGGIGPDDAPLVRCLDHPRLAGVDINSCFETAPAMKDARLVARFIRMLRP